MSRRLFAFGLFRADLNKQTARGLFPPAVFSHTRRVFHRGRRASFVAPGVCSVLWRAGRGRGILPFRARSAIRRAGHLLRSVRMVDVGGGSCRSVAYSCSPFTNTQCLPRRHEVPFVAPGVCSVLETCWTREDVFSVPRLSVYTVKILHVPKFFFHRHAVSSIAPGVCSVLETCWTREGTPTVPGTECHPSRTQSVFRRAGGFIRSVAVLQRFRGISATVLWLFRDRFPALFIRICF